MANPTITINATGITVSGPLIAGEPVAVTASGLSLPEGAALTLALSSRAPNALLASCVLAESEETPGTWTGTLETASRQMAVYFATAAADDTRPAVLELVETTTRDSLALLVTSIRNSALIPSSSPCAVAPVYLPVPGPPGDPQPSDAAPQMDGTAAAGTSDEYARADHVHPSDTHIGRIVSPDGTVELTVGNNQRAAVTKGAGGKYLAFAVDVPPPSDAQPEMDGVASAGDATVYARADHVHPVDTSRASAADVTAIQNLIPSSASTSNKLATAADIPSGQVNADWTATSGPAEILHKPNLATVATSGNYADLTNKPTIPAAQVNADWNAASGVAQILNKPTIPAAQVQSDWNEADTSSKAYIQNKPTIPSTANFVQKSGDTMTGPLTAPIIFLENTGALVVRGATENSNVSFTESNGMPIVGCSESNYNRNFRFPMTTLAIPSGSTVDVCMMDNLATAFSTSSTYAEGDYCTHEGLLYKCTTAVSTAGAWNAANWSAVSAMGEMPAPITVDSAMSTTSTNPVQNKVVDEAVKGRVPWANSSKNAVSIGPRTGNVGSGSLVVGSSDNTASNSGSIAVGGNNTASGINGAAFGQQTTASSNNAFACGYRARAKHQDSFVWSGGTGYYDTTARGQFRINPYDGVSGFFIGSDSLASLFRYAFASPTPTVSGTAATVACEDRAINDFTVATGITSLTITPPSALSGRARDFFCRVTLTDSSLPTVTLAGGTIDIGASEVAGMTQGVNLLMFTEIASGHWLASRRSAS